MSLSSLIDELQTINIIASPIREHLGTLGGVAFTGNGPHLESDLESLTDHISFDDEMPELLVIGWDDYEEDTIRSWAADYDPQKTLFMTQEAFIDFVLFGYNWWDNCTDLRDKQLGYHAGFQFLREISSFLWPDEEADEASGDSEVEIDFSDQSELMKRGYYVGKKNGRRLSHEERQVKLRACVDQLGLARTATTLHAIMSNFRRQKGGAEKYREAISRWTKDLDWLRETYHTPFDWPEY